MDKEYDDQGIGWIGGKRTTVTASEYAKLKGVSRQTVHWYIKKGKVSARRIGSVWLIDLDK